MGLVRRNAPGVSKYAVRLGFAAVLSITGSGCAGLGTFRHGDYPFLGGFWDFGRSYEVEPHNDRYARQMHEGKALMAARQGETPAADGDRPQTPPADKDKAKNGDKDKEGSSPGTKPKPRTISGSTNPASAEDGIRVTLGRPESLPVVGASPMPGSGGKLAAAAPKWKQEPTEARRGRDDADPAVRPARRQTEPALARVAPRNLDAAAAARVRAEDPIAVAESTAEKRDEILGRAAAKLKSLGSYQVSMTRVERVGGRLQPEETVLLSVRQSPRAVRLQWEGGPNQGREVIYSTALDEQILHVRMGGGPIPLPPMKISVDSPLIMRNSRHSIKEAGFDTLIANLNDGPSGGKTEYTGKVQPDGIDGSCHRFVRTAADGERWEILLDDKTLLPRQVTAHSPQGELLERYSYRDVKENPAELAASDAFDPDARWGKSKGLFSRLAGAASSLGGDEASTSTTR